MITSGGVACVVAAAENIDRNGSHPQKNGVQ